MQTIDPNEKDKALDAKKNERTPEEIKQQQSDPNITELKGLTDPKEKLEPEGTDNPIKQK